MFLLDKPYISNDLLDFATQHHTPVLDNDVVRKAFSQWEGGQEKQQFLPLVSDDSFVDHVRKHPEQRVYANSENTIEWISHNLEFTAYPRMIGLFKNKVRFRELLQELYPEYYFRGVALEELDAVDPETLPMPCILKPCVGFYSLGVHKISSVGEWHTTVRLVRSEVDRIKSMYPQEVLRVDQFIIEECLEGEEYAVDLYFDADGEPVILNILGHMFASEDDVSDRIYYTSPHLIARWHDAFTGVLRQLSKLSGVRNFPAHIELRVDDCGNIGFIEVNPMRFAGWCLTEIAQHAYGINPYEYYIDDKRPDWETLLPARQDKIFSIVVADLPPHITHTEIASIDYDAFVGRFSHVHDVRRIDYTEYPVFAMLIVEVPAEDLSELYHMLTADLSQYIQLK